jgi:hypothetical protein
MMDFWLLMMDFWLGIGFVEVGLCGFDYGGQYFYETFGFFFDMAEIIAYKFSIFFIN